MGDTGPRHSEALRPGCQLVLKKDACDGQQMLKKDDTQCDGFLIFFSLLHGSSLEKDLESDDKACNVSSSYYVSTPATKET